MVQEGRATVELGLVATQGQAGDALPQLVDELRPALAERYPSVDWRIVPLVDRLVDPPAGLLDLVSATRRRLLEEGWDLAVTVTELPLRVRRRPVVRHASTTHKTAIVSLPALGPVQWQRRLRDAILELVSELVGEEEGMSESTDERSTRERRERRLLAELASDVPDGQAAGAAFVARVLSGNLRLLAGMVRANRPWRLAVRLYRALVAALAAVTFGVLTQDIWRLNASLSVGRLIAIMVVSLVATVVVLIAGHDLWERAPSRGAREQVVLFNVATLLTVLLGVGALYLALLALTGVGVALLIPPDLLHAALGQPATFSDYASLAWLVSSLATIGGALGAGLESGESVREAAYSYHAEE